MTIFDTPLKCSRCREKGVGSGPCVTREDMCPACTSLTLEEKQQLGVHAYKQRNYKKKKKSDKLDRIEELVDPSPVSVLGHSSSAGAGDSLESVDYSPTKPADPPTFRPPRSEFAQFKDEFSTCFTRIEFFFSSVGAIPPSAIARHGLLVGRSLLLP